MIQVPEPEVGEVIEITTKKKYKEPLPPFSMVGNGMSNRYGISLDIIEVCLELNQSELKLLQFFRDCYASNIMKKEGNPNLVVPLRWEKFTAYLKKALEKQYSHLEYLGVIVRIKRGTYLVNPTLFVPQHDYSSIYGQWIAAKRKDEK